MSYGRGEYGQRGYGGSSFESGGPTLVTSDPLNGATGVSPTAPISFTISSPAGLDEFSLNVNVDGDQAIVGGVFQAGYSGTIVQDPETEMVVTISGHPPIAGGSTPVDIDITDLAGEQANLNFTYDTENAVILPETVTVLEGLTATLDYVAALPEAVPVSEALTSSLGTAVALPETLSILEQIETGSLLIEALDASTIRVSFPQELRFDGTPNIANFRVTPVSAGAAGVNLVSIQSGVEVFQTGSSCQGIDLNFSEPPIFGTLPFLGEPGFTSNILDFRGTADIDADNVGDYIEITNGKSAGVYRIIGHYITNAGIDAVLPFTPRVLLDRPFVVRDPANGYVEGLAEVLDVQVGEEGTTATLRLPNVTADDPLLQVLFAQDRTNGGFVGSLTIQVQELVTFIDHNTFTIKSSGSFVPNDLASRIFVIGQITSKLQWRHISGVQTLTFRTNLSPGTKLTGDGDYLFEAKNLFTKVTGEPFQVSAVFKALATNIPKPRILGGTYLIGDGTLLVQFDQEMQVDDANLTNPTDYIITGPSPVQVKRVRHLSPTTVGLETTGIEVAGDYTLTVSTATPKDAAGNPLDPTFNTVIFTAAVPETTRSVFTDKGPIAKPALTLQSGVNAVLDTYNEVTLPGATLTSSLIGQYVRLSGGSLNGGTFRIASVLTTTRARLANASFTLPDPDSGTLAWEVFDPRNGQIADDPADVTVRVNGSPVTPEAVVGLLGQVVLTSAPAESDDVEIDYSWCCNPTVEFRRLNSREFRLNSWNRDLGYPRDRSQHKYRYNNALIRPSDFEPDNMSAKLDQPELRELHYRAYERAYTPVLNDPSLLLLNSPIHKIAFPPAERFVTEEFVAYEGVGLPEAVVTNPWTRVGTGTASSAGGQLTITDSSTGTFPTGQPIFWTREIDLTFQHVFAMSWRFLLDTLTTPEGVFTGVAAGYSDERVAVVVGYLEEAGVKKIGFLKRGSADSPTELTDWIGGLDGFGNPTGAPIDFDWDILHSYRIFRDPDGTIKLFVDGEIDERLRVTPDELPFLEELAAPFDAIQGAFFGSLSRPAQSVSTWDFVRYLITPTNPRQFAASSFVSYEANNVPETDVKPWTPVGFHGTETILSTDFLLLASTSATDAPTAADVGLVGGDYRGFVRFEPLLTQSSEIVLDAEVQLVTHTHGISPYGLTMAVDDGVRLMQLAWFPDQATPKLSYGGRSFPEDFDPFNWQVSGGATAVMAGRILRIEDASTLDGKVYFHDDTEPAVSVNRVVHSTFDYILEFRCRVESFTVDGANYAGAFAQVYDSSRSVGLLFEEDAGTKYVSFHADGVPLGPADRFAFDFADGDFHTYRLTKSTTGNLVSLFIDGVFIGSTAYSNFATPPPDPIGQVSFGSSTPASVASESIVEWAYVNAWRLRTDLKHFVGLWKGSDSDSLLGYHLPLKASGKGAQVVGNALGDANADFVAAGVAAGDKLIIDAGPNRGVYNIAAVGTPTSLTIVGVWPVQPSLVDYRIAQETDWTALHKYRLTRDSTGEVAVLLDADPQPLIRVGYNSLDLPESGLGIIRTLADGLPAVAFGSFDSEELASSIWDYVRYGLVKSANELRIAPHHQFINQWNVMHSPERLFTVLPHTLTDFKSSSTGQPPKTEPDFLADPGLPAFTQLNEGTPLVPSTQTFEVRSPFPVEEFVSALNRPEDVLNSDADFVLNDSTRRFRLIVPNDVLYSCLDVIEQTTGELDLITPFDDDDCSPNISDFTYQKEICLEYTGDDLPENDTAAPTPWQLVSDSPVNVVVSSLSGILTYGTDGVGTRTVYRNNSPLPDHPSLQSEARFRLKVLNDATLGTGNTQIKFGLSAPGLTVALTFLTTLLGERFVLVIDQNNGNILGSASFDFLDGNFHDFRLVRDPGLGVVRVFIDS